MRHMDAKGANVDKRVAGIAARQHGVVSVRQLYLAGMSRNRVRRRIEAGRLHRVHRGVYAVGHRGISAHGRWMAAVLACGGVVASEERTVLGRWGAAVSHRSAAELWGLLPPRSGPVDVSVVGGAGRKRRAGIQLHRRSALPPASVTSRHGIPVTTPPRTISDLRRSTAQKGGGLSRRELRRAVRQAEVLGLSLGSGVPRDRTRSELEYLFLKLCRARRLPEPEVNAQVASLLVDFLWPDHRLVAETDGYRYHRGRAAFEDDRKRDLKLRTLGYDVVRLSYRQVTEEPDRVAGVLREALSGAS